jgi:replicative DNA helicase
MLKYLHKGTNYTFKVNIQFKGQKMNSEEARQFIISRTNDYLKPDKSKKGRICPICGSGTGKNGTGMSTKDNIHYTCWAGKCFKHNDIIDIIGAEYGLKNYNEQLKKAAEIFGITIEEKSYQGLSINYKLNTNSKTNRIGKKNLQESEQDYTFFFNESSKNINKTDYHRGLSTETIKRFNLGYVENWRHPKSPSAPFSPRLIIPTSKYSYLARDTRSNLSIAERKYSKSKVGKQRIFNSKALTEACKPIFVVEGELDALSIIDVGGEAVALGSISNKNLLLEMFKSYVLPQPIIVALDNDEPGEKASREIFDGLKELGIASYRVNLTTLYKDANDFLNADREGFRIAVKRTENAILELEKGSLTKESVSYSLSGFFDRMEKTKNLTSLSTGFNSLDFILGGGFYPGLYIVGAISSLGKTTFCLQIVDKIARQNNDVLIFSLEMSRDELVAKNLSRLTFLKGNPSYFKTTRDLLNGFRYSRDYDADVKFMCDIVEDYYKYSDNLYITEGMGDVGIEIIREKLENHIRITKRNPVVLIDYIQIMAPVDIRATDKQNIDKIVLELKRLSRDFGISVLCISSFNRDNYMSPVNLSSFKESGAIEYSSDVLIGLQYYGMDYQEDETSIVRQKRIRNLIKDFELKGRNREPQSIQVKILKNRNGSKGDFVLNFYPMFNCFVEPENNKTIGNDEVWSKESGSY